MGMKETNRKHRQGTSEILIYKFNTLNKDEYYYIYMLKGCNCDRFLYKGSLRNEDKRTLELYLSVALAHVRGSIRSELTEFSPLLIYFFTPFFISPEEFSLLFFSYPHLRRRGSFCKSPLSQGPNTFSILFFSPFIFLIRNISITFNFSTHGRPTLSFYLPSQEKKNPVRF